MSAPTQAPARHRTQAPGNGRGPQRSSLRPPRRGRRTPTATTRRVAPPRPSWRGLPFAGFVTALLGGALVVLLLVNNSLAAGSFAQAKMKAEQVALIEAEQALQQEVLALSSPTRLRASATAMGLVAAATTAYIDPRTGEILGTPKPAGSAGLADAGAAAALTGDAESLAATDPTAADVGAGQLAGESEDPSGVEVPTAQDGDGGADEATAPEGDGASVSGQTAMDRAIVTGAQ